MTNWKHRVSGIRRHITSDDSPEGVIKAVNAIADVVEANGVFEGFDRQYDARGIEDAEEFNVWLADLYDFCDQRKIWIELEEKDEKQKV